MAGGALGALARYLVGALALPISGQLPWGTIIINITGSFVIGLFGTLTLASGRFPVSETLRLFVMIGICGGFTTFSSFSLQTLDLMRGGAIDRAAIVLRQLEVKARQRGHRLARAEQADILCL